MSKLCFAFFTLLFGVSCQSQPPLEILKTGFYEAASDSNKMYAALEKSSLSISLHFHQGIGVFDKARHEWIKLDKIEDLKPYLAKCKNREFVVISTGMAEWDKEPEFIKRIATWCREFGFDAVVVSPNNNQGLCISEIIVTR